MSKHKEAAERRALHSDPINVTCGKCRTVFAFEDGYGCPHCDYCKVEKEIIIVVDEEAV